MDLSTPVKESFAWLSFSAVMFFGGLTLGGNFRVSVDNIIAIRCDDKHIKFLYFDKPNNIRKWHITEIGCGE